MFRFTIRELVLVTLVVAMGVGYFVDRQRLSRATHGQAVAERHLDEYRRAYIELHRAVEREGLTITRSSGGAYIADSKPSEGD
jgi:hypothetical protein